MQVMAKKLLFVLLFTPVILNAGDTAVLLTPPGLRPVKNPSIAVPAPYLYANRHLPLPQYRDSQGNPAQGWSQKYISTRRFNSDQSAWIYYRLQDLQRSVTMARGEDDTAFCIWPGGTTIIIESYHGNAVSRPGKQLIDIAVIAKANTNSAAMGEAFLPVEWSYGRFTSAAQPAINATKVHECHQCHAIAFHLTGDLVFTRLP
jgi:hypothetical protein